MQSRIRRGISTCQRLIGLYMIHSIVHIHPIFVLDTELHHRLAIH